MEVVTNFVPVELGSRRIHVYLVTVTNRDAQEGEEEEAEGRAQVREAAVRSSAVERALGGDSGRVVFDGREYAYAGTRVHSAWADGAFCADVDGGEAWPGRFRVELRVHRQYDTGAVQRLCAGGGGSEHISGLLFALDSIVRCELRPWLRDVGGRHLSPHGAVATDAGFDVWWEYRVAMHPAQGRLLLSVAARAVPVLAVPTLAALADAFFRGGARPGDDAAAWARLGECVRGLRVAVPGGASGRVTGLAPDRRAVIGGAAAPVDLAQCALDGRQVLGRIGGWQRRRLMEASALAPAQRLALLRHGAALVARACQGSGALRRLGIRAGPALATAPAERLAAPQLRLGAGAAADVAPETGLWELGGRHVRAGAEVRAWAVLVLAARQAMGEAQARAFAVRVAQAGSELGVRFVQAAPPLVYGSPQAVARAVEDACAAAQRAAGGARAQLLVCVLPAATAALYGELKRVALTRAGVHTQCVLLRNALGHRPRLLRGVLLKINAKLGGATAEALPAGLLDRTATMVLAADVTHSAEAGAMSVAAVVWSVDAAAQRFAGLVVQHPPRVEIIENMDAIVRHCLRVFYARTGRKPARILYYRDGVNDAQLAPLRAVEVAGIRRACRLVDPAYAPDLAVVVARKRHHSRFLLPEGANCPPGTLTAAAAAAGPHAAASFHLLAHRSVFGVSRPVYFLVLDAGGLAPELLRTLTYHLCYTYPLFTRPATMPAPLYYAHRLAARGRLQLSQRFDALPCFAAPADAKRARRNARAQPVPHLVPVHPDLADTMYFT
ncbi:hypothetical protein H4R18_002464 [Coemansia javaensis]|uniref:Piwi domain-containing protein n=1 Tax=Coemansia javaensis TaxID=2761396 RepID=A0A9W8HAQ1_9FUNG|nr:hypothetical protein H4R18_002464 [Coemansia javaensis]